jgi:Ni/Co efflux regulator RcnB
MKNRLAKTLLATAAIAAFAAPMGAQARQGADDPAGHVRQESRQVVAAPATTKKASDDSTTSRSRTEIRHRHRHGRRGAVRRAEDNSTVRHARGADDGPNHR